MADNEGLKPRKVVITDKKNIFEVPYDMDVREWDEVLYNYDEVGCAYDSCDYISEVMEFRADARELAHFKWLCWFANHYYDDLPRPDAIQQKRAVVFPEDKKDAAEQDPVPRGVRQTNADKLRSMTDEELCEELFRLMDNAVACPECFQKSGKERLKLYLKARARD